MKGVNAFIGILLLLGLQCTPLGAWASCTTSGTSSYTATIPFTKLTVPRDKSFGPIGGIITFASGPAVSSSCSSGSMGLMKFGKTLVESSTPGVYETNVPGIGIKVWVDFQGTVIVGNAMTAWWVNPGTNLGVYLAGVKMQFYVIGPVSTGRVVLPSPFVENWINTAVTPNGAALANTMSVSTEVDIVTLACETPDITVDMGDHKSTEFTGKGATSHTVPFNFEIKNCAAGMSSVSYQFDPAANVKLVGSGNGQYLTLSSDSTAKYVGLQVMYENGTMVPFGTKIRYTSYNAASARSYVIPMKARYIQTGNIIVGGKANTALEFTMMYE